MSLKKIKPNLKINSMYRLLFVVGITMLICSCSSKSELYIEPYLSDTAVMEKYIKNDSLNYVDDFLKLSATINIGSYSKTPIFDSVLKNTNFRRYASLNESKTLLVLIVPSDPPKLSVKEKAKLKSLLASKQTCFPSILPKCSSISRCYSNIGNEALFLLVNDEPKFQNKILRSTDLFSLNRDSLLKEIKY